jgi:hypothetical protein
MSTLSESEQDPLNPSDRLYYAPRWMRERSETPLTASPETGSESLTRPPQSFDALLEEAVAESLRHPLDPAVMHEPPGFVRELDRRMAILSVAGRFAAAIGVSAIVALFFVIMVPASRDYARQPEGSGTSVSGMLQSLRTALSQPSQKDDDLKPALSEFQTILAQTPASLPSQPSLSVQPTPSAPAVSREESETLLQQFVQWQQKPAPASAP